MDDKNDFKRDADASVILGEVAIFSTILFFVFTCRCGIISEETPTRGIFYAIFEFVYAALMFLPWLPGFIGLVLGIIGLHSSKRNTAKFGIILSIISLFCYIWWYSYLVNNS